MRLTDWLIHPLFLCLVPWEIAHKWQCLWVENICKECLIEGPVELEDWLLLERAKKKRARKMEMKNHPFGCRESRSKRRGGRKSDGEGPSRWNYEENSVAQRRSVFRRFSRSVVIY